MKEGKAASKRNPRGELRDTHEMGRLESGG
jgi:hypothetical protein